MAIDIPEEAYTLAQAYWPGPDYLAVEKAPHVTPVVTGGLETSAFDAAHDVLRLYCNLPEWQLLRLQRTRTKN
nr:hypothetical protein [Vibrio sp. 03_296]